MCAPSLSPALPTSPSLFPHSLRVQHPVDADLSRPFLPCVACAPDRRRVSVQTAGEGGVPWEPTGFCARGGCAGERKGSSRAGSSRWRVWQAQATRPAARGPVPSVPLDVEVLWWVRCPGRGGLREDHRAAATEKTCGSAGRVVCAEARRGSADGTARREFSHDSWMSWSPARTHNVHGTRAQPTGYSLPGTGAGARPCDRVVETDAAPHRPGVVGCAAHSPRNKRCSPSWR